MKTRLVPVGGVGIGPGAAPCLIAGPCVIESEELCRRLAEECAAAAAAAGFGYVFKASFDKANRTSRASFRGPGLEAGLEILAGVKERAGVPVLTDVHESAQCTQAAQVADALQIPAFLCRQTDLLGAAAASGKPVNVKKGQFLAPEDMAQVVEKLREGRAAGILLTERGTSFGYHNLVNDFRGLPVMRALGVPVIFDGTHSVQQPGALGKASGGQRRFVPVLCRAAAAAGVDGFFLEVHPQPETAPSDGPNMITPQELKQLLPTLKAIGEIVRAVAEAETPPA